MQHQINFGSRSVIFNLKYSQRKSLGIKVHPDYVEVLAPLKAKENRVLERVKAKAPWILKQISHFDKYKPTSSARQFINGETHLYLGRQYRLKIVPDEVDTVKTYRGYLYIHSRKPRKDILQTQLDDWYRQRALVVFSRMIEEVLPRFGRYGIVRVSLSIRTMSKRWGSCTQKGTIILNKELIKAPKGCIEYVIIHELCHLVHHNHKKAFHNLLSRMLPDWEKWKDRLEYSLA